MMPPKQQRLFPNSKSNIISIEGNIGSGKSTFLKILAESLPEIEMLAEPVCSWQHVGQSGFNLLDLYYNQPERWGLTFQSYALMTRCQTWQSYQNLQTTAKARISERSVLADRYIFAASMRDSNYLSSDQYNLYVQTYQGLNQMMDIKPLAGIIYLRCEPHVCESRIKKRNRSEEAGIPFNYLDLLHRKHEEWLNDEGSQTKRVLVLDVSEDLIGNQKKYDELIDKAREFINSVLSG